MEKLKKKRKALLVLPLFALPLLALTFYALGGGRGVPQESVNQQAGINTELPDAKFGKEEPKDKMTLYDQADRDSATAGKNLDDITKRLGFSDAADDVRTKAIEDRLEKIQSRMDEPVSRDYRVAASIPPTREDRQLPEQSISADIDRLEALMKNMQEEKTVDPETEQLNAMLQSILDIQHPERVKDRYRNPADTVYADSLFKAVRASIVDKQKAVQGATVRLRLEDSVTLNGYHIPKGHEIFATCRITNQRLLLDITNIRLGTSIIPVRLSVYGLDGMEGLYAPEAVLTETMNLGTDNALRGIGMYGLDQSIATQVAGAGIDAAKNVLSRRIRKIKVKLQPGRPVLLKNNQR